MAALVLVAAQPTAALFGLPELAWAFQAFALVPLMQGFVHPDLSRYQRASRFRPMIASELIGVTISLLVVIPLTWWLGDFRLMLVVLIIEQAFRTLVSHTYGERDFEVAWDRGVALQALRFGAPLVLT